MEDFVERPYSVIINVNMLSKLFENLMCRSCKISPLFIVLEGKYGFFYKVNCTFKRVIKCKSNVKSNIHLKKNLSILVVYCDTHSIFE